MIHRRKDGQVEAEEYGVRFRGALGPNDIAMTMVITWRFLHLPSVLQMRRDGVRWKRGAMKKAEEITPIVATMMKANKRVEITPGSYGSRALAAAVAYLLRVEHRGLPAYLGPGSVAIGKKASELYDQKVRRTPWQ